MTNRHPTLAPSTLHRRTLRSWKTAPRSKPPSPGRWTCIVASTGRICFAPACCFATGRAARRWRSCTRPSTAGNRRWCADCSSRRQASTSNRSCSARRTGNLRSHFGIVFSHIEEAPVLDALLRKTHWLKDQSASTVHAPGARAARGGAMIELAARHRASSAGGCGAKIGEWLAVSGMHDVMQDERMEHLRQHAKEDFEPKLRLLRIAIGRKRGASRAAAAIVPDAIPTNGSCAWRRARSCGESRPTLKISCFN